MDTAGDTLAKKAFETFCDSRASTTEGTIGDKLATKNTNRLLDAPGYS